VACYIYYFIEHEVKSSKQSQTNKRGVQDTQRVKEISNKTMQSAMI